MMRGRAAPPPTPSPEEEGAFAVAHSAAIWIWSNGTSPASWHFVTIDGDAGEQIAAHEAMRRLELGRGRGFGSVKVAVRIGGTQWNTSVFPSKTSGGYLLPIKAAVRKAENLTEGDKITVKLDLL